MVYARTQTSADLDVVKIIRTACSSRFEWYKIHVVCTGFEQVGEVFLAGSAEIWSNRDENIARARSKPVQSARILYHSNRLEQAIRMILTTSKSAEIWVRAYTIFLVTP
jgi:hypothetical protein